MKMGKKRSFTAGKKRSRKEKRKEERQQKKARKNDHYFKIRNKAAPIHPSKMPKEMKEEANFSSSQKVSDSQILDNASESETEMKEVPKRVEKTLIQKIKESSEKSKRIAEKRKVAEKRSRDTQLKEANKVEERQIKHLATLMKINKRKKGKTQAVPKIFTDDGLDYLLDATDSDKLKSMRSEEPTFEDADDDFESDFALIKGEADPVATDGDSTDEEDSDAGGEMEAALPDPDLEGNSGSDVMSDDGSENIPEDSDGSSDKCGDGDADSEDAEESAGGVDYGVADESERSECPTDAGGGDADAPVTDTSEDDESIDDLAEKKKTAKGKKRKPQLAEEPEEEVEGNEVTEAGGPKKKRRRNEAAKHSGGVWEDIYGRMRGQDGSILTATGSDPAPASAAAPTPAAPAEAGGRYVPPALRAQQMALGNDKKSELALLRRRLQGQLNRLSAVNARAVLALVEELYAAHARHDTSQTLTQLVHEACVSAAAARPARLVLEHVLLIAALHANVGTEVGAHFLLKTVQRFHKLLTAEPVDGESKELDNLAAVLAQLYSLRVTDSRVVYDILALLLERFSAKDVELILVILRSVGFTMRKDDPRALKELIVRLQSRASTATAEAAPAEGSRVRFLLDIVMALRNNNMNKIPQYDPALGEEIRKLLKTLVNPSQSVTELTISLEDLLKAEERGKWWVVGSAWSGVLKERQEPGQEQEAAPRQAAASQQYSAELLELARQQRMNTDLRRNVFCVLMTAEDYLDCFEKLVRLGVRGPQQEQEMVSVVVGCGLRERSYNPYYSHLLERLCTTDRKYQMRIKVAVWDHLKDLAGLGSVPAGNLAKMLSHLISSAMLTIAVLKVVEFSEMSRPMVRFLRQLLLSLLLQPEDGDAVRTTFSRISGPHLKHLRDSLVLFLHHFVLRNKSKLADERTVEALEMRTKLAIAALKVSEGRLQL